MAPTISLQNIQFCFQISQDSRPPGKDLQTAFAPTLASLPQARRPIVFSGSCADFIFDFCSLFFFSAFLCYWFYWFLFVLLLLVFVRFTGFCSISVSFQISCVLQEIVNAISCRISNMFEVSKDASAELLVFGNFYTPLKMIQYP